MKQTIKFNGDFNEIQTIRKESKHQICMRIKKTEGR